MNERVPLSFLLVQRKGEEPPVEPTVPFAAMHGEDPKIVVAILERTCVVSSATDQYERLAVLHENILVDPAVIAWRPVTADYEGSRVRNAKGGGTSPNSWRRRLHSTDEERQAQRERADESARKNQQEVARANAAEAAREDRRLRREREEMQRQAAAPIIPLPLAGTVESASVEKAGPALPAFTPSTVTATAATTLLRKTKHCVACGEDKPADDFPTGKPGRQRCTPCRAKPVEVAPVAVPEPRHTNVPQGVITRPPRHRTRPEGCLRKCRPFRDDRYHAPGCPHRIEQLQKFDRKAPATPGCAACEQPGRGIRHAVGCPHRRGPLSNTEMVAMAAGTLHTVSPTTAPESTALVVAELLPPIPVIAGLPTRSDWLALLARLRLVKAENDALKADMRQMVTDLQEVLDS